MNCDKHVNVFLHLTRGCWVILMFLPLCEWGKCDCPKSEKEEWQQYHCQACDLVLNKMTPLWILCFALTTLELITIPVKRYSTISTLYFDPQFMQLVPGSRLSICNLCPSTDFPQALLMFHLDLTFRCFWDWTDLDFFVKTQCRPIISSLSEIKKNSLKMYTNPLLCQQDCSVTYSND